MRPSTILLLLLLAATCCTVPVAASTSQYIGGTPQLAAYITGTSEYAPGQDATITVAIQNTGADTMKFVGHSPLPQNDLPTTAKIVTAGLSGGDSPVIVKTGPQDLGDIASPGSTTAAFSAKITADATEGEYTIPLTLRYRYLSNSINPLPSSDTVAYQYTNATQVIPLTVRITPSVKVHVVGVEAENLVVGTEGYVNLTIRNTGSVDATRASVILSSTGPSGIQPADSSVYIGDLARNQTVTCRYRVSVSTDALPQEYSVGIAVAYTDADGKPAESPVETAAIPVGSKPGFAVTSGPAPVTAGKSATIAVNYTNTGSVTAYGALARLTLTDPLSGSDAMAYLGDVAPGRTVTARFTVSAAGSAAPGTYTLATNVRFRDAAGVSLTSDTATARVQVLPAPAGSSLPIVAVVAAVLVLAGGAYYWFVHRRRRM